MTSPASPPDGSAAEPQILGIGAGGHAKVVIDALGACGLPVAGLIDASPALHGDNVLGVPVLGGDDQLPTLWQQGLRHAFIGVGTARNTAARSRIWQQLLDLNYEIIDVVHPTAVISLHATIGRGVTILARAVINAGAQLGDNILVNTGAIVEHDCVIGDHVHLASGCMLAGGVMVEAGAFLGAGAVVKPGVRIGANSVVGAGAVVVRDVPASVVVSGVPARIHVSEVPPCAIRIAS